MNRQANREIINIYSSYITKKEADPLLRDIEQLSRLPGVREVFKVIVEDAKAKLAELQKPSRTH